MNDAASVPGQGKEGHQREPHECSRLWTASPHIPAACLCQLNCTPPAPPRCSSCSQVVQASQNIDGNLGAPAAQAGGMRMQRVLGLLIYCHGCKLVGQAVAAAGAPKPLDSAWSPPAPPVYFACLNGTPQCAPDQQLGHNHHILHRGSGGGGSRLARVPTKASNQRQACSISKQQWRGRVPLRPACREHTCSPREAPKKDTRCWLLQAGRERRAKLTGRPRPQATAACLPSCSCRALQATGPSNCPLSPTQPHPGPTCRP